MQNHAVRRRPRYSRWLSPAAAAVASDSPTFEAYPPDLDKGALHETLIGLWGMPIGEMFYLERLADDCEADGVYCFFFTSAPLNKFGGVASPPNALAIK